MSFVRTLIFSLVFTIGCLGSAYAAPVNHAACPEPSDAEVDTMLNCTNTCDDAAVFACGEAYADAGSCSVCASSGSCSSRDTETCGGESMGAGACAACPPGYTPTCTPIDCVAELGLNSSEVSLYYDKDCAIETFGKSVGSFTTTQRNSCNVSVTGNSLNSTNDSSLAPDVFMNCSVYCDDDDGFCGPQFMDYDDCRAFQTLYYNSVVNCLYAPQRATCSSWQSTNSCDLFVCREIQDNLGTLAPDPPEPIEPTHSSTVSGSSCGPVPIGVLQDVADTLDTLGLSTIKFTDGDKFHWRKGFRYKCKYYYMGKRIKEVIDFMCAAGQAYSAQNFGIAGMNMSLISSTLDDIKDEMANVIDPSALTGLSPTDAVNAAMGMRDIAENNMISMFTTILNELPTFPTGPDRERWRGSPCSMGGIPLP